jgi:hypothetical protein
MTQAAEVLTELRGRGVSVTVDGDVLCLKPRRALDDVLLARVREVKPAILEVLRKLPPQVTAVPSKTRAIAMCWHCGGSGECKCSTCGMIKPSTVWAAGECAACKPKKVRVQ